MKNRIFYIVQHLSNSVGKFYYKVQYFRVWLIEKYEINYWQKNFIKRKQYCDN